MTTYAITAAGTAKWASGPLVTASAAVAYGAARGWADWSDEAAIARHILDASTWLRATWSPPTVYDADLDIAIGDALIEAARLIPAGPLLGGAAYAEPQIIRDKTGPLETEWAEVSQADLLEGRLSLVSAMLAAAGASRLFGGVMVRLSKA